MIIRDDTNYIIITAISRNCTHREPRYMQVDD